MCAYTGSILAQNDTSDVPKHSVEESGLKNGFFGPQSPFFKKNSFFCLLEISGSGVKKSEHPDFECFVGVSG